MKEFYISFADQINKGISGRAGASKAKVEGAFLWQESLNRLSALSNKESASNHWRLTFLACFFFLITLFLLIRTSFLQVIHGQENLFISETNRILIERKVAPRGLIYDSNGVILAKNTPGFRATLNYSQVPVEKRQEIKQTLINLLSISEGEVEAKFNDAKISPFTTITLKSGISHEEKVALDALQDKLPGIGIAQDILRAYPKGQFLAHVLGYLREISQDELKEPNNALYLAGDFLGCDGLERTYEEFLQGKVGRSLIEVDAAGNLSRVVGEEEPVPGNNLYLSLDSSFQEKAAQLLSAAIEKYAATAGVFIAEEVESGQVLSFVVEPSFDNNLFSGGIATDDYERLIEDSGEPLFDRAIAGTYPPGSTVKPLVAAAALQEKIITPFTRIDDYPQVIKIGGWEFPDWTVAWGRAAHGIMTVRKAISESCDIFFYKIGGGYHDQCYTDNTKCPIDGLGVEKLKTYFNLFGLGQKTGIDLPGETKGLVPDPIWKQEVKDEDWFLGNTYHISIGQGDLLTTPIQILQSINTIANKGKLLKPRFVEKIENVDGEIVKSFDEPEIIREDFINKDYIQVVAEGMRLAVSEGIIYPLRDAKVEVAAKTGTAEFGTKNAKGEYETHAWVTGFAPYDDPKISFVLLLESGGASSNAAEVAREILDEYFGR